MWSILVSSAIEKNMNIGAKTVINYCFGTDKTVFYLGFQLVVRQSSTCCAWTPPEPLTEPGGKNVLMETQNILMKKLELNQQDTSNTQTDFFKPIKYKNMFRLLEFEAFQTLRR